MEFRKFIKSFTYAYKGIKIVWKERNFKFHILATFLVLILAYILKVSNIEFIILILTISIVLMAEMINTAIEIICNLLRDKLNLGYHETEIPRDIGAAIVLVCAVCAVVIGSIIFLPKLF